MTETTGKSGRSGNIGADVMQTFQLTYRLFLDPRVSVASKVLVPLAAVAYFLFPIDFLPDVVPFLGQIDDIAVLILLMKLFIMMAPQDVVSAYKSGARAQASSDPKADYQSGSATGAAGARDENVVDADFRVVHDA
jgi:uncharacterized membrane protein YkvA (DUF1232 family)